MSIEKGNFNTIRIIGVHRLTSCIAGQHVQFSSIPEVQS